MCGRYALSADRDALALEFEVDAVTTSQLPPRWNIAPTSDVYIVKERVADGVVTRELVVARWGLVPSWAQDASNGAKLANARSETVAVKPSFRSAFAQRRCLLPADGWYEWMPVAVHNGKMRKQPYYFSVDGVAAFAAIYEWWRPRDATADVEPLLTASLLTTEAVGPAADIHARMPVLLPQRLWSAWLDPLTSQPSTEVVSSAVAALPTADVRIRAVSMAVNQVRNDGPHLLDHCEPEPSVAGPHTLF